jgi:1-phosphofructokinase
MDPTNLSTARVAVVALNPAIDQTICLYEFRQGFVNRANSMRLDPGGKGVNVAGFLSAAGCDVTLTGFLGDGNAAIFEQQFARTAIGDRFIRVPGSTRTSVKIVDEAHRQTTEINLPGLSPSPGEIDQLLVVIDELAANSHWIVLTGSLPPGVPADFYALIIQRAKLHGCHIALDTSQPALLPGIQAGPALAKPNLSELEDLVGRTFCDEAEIRAAARQLLSYGIGLAVISLGSRGAIFCDRNASLLAVPPEVPVCSTVGAGDAMLSGLLVGQILGLDLQHCAQLATAFATAAVSSLDRRLPSINALIESARHIPIIA